MVYTRASRVKRLAAEDLSSFFSTSSSSSFAIPLLGHPLLPLLFPVVFFVLLVLQLLRVFLVRFFSSSSLPLEGSMPRRTRERWSSRLRSRLRYLVSAK